MVKLFGREDHEQQRFVDHSNERIRDQVEVASLQARFDLYVGLTLSIGTALVLYFGVLHIQRGMLTLGALLMVMLYLTQIYEPLRNVSKKNHRTTVRRCGAERVFALLDQTPEVTQRRDARHITRAKGEVVFRGVSFPITKRNPFCAM